MLEIGTVRAFPRERRRGNSGSDQAPLAIGELGVAEHLHGGEHGFDGFDGFALELRGQGFEAARGGGRARDKLVNTFALVRDSISGLINFRQGSLPCPLPLSSTCQTQSCRVLRFQ